MNDEPIDPRDAYRSRWDDRRSIAGRWARRRRGIADARLGVFVAALVALGLSAGAGWFSSWWVALPAAVLAALVVLDDAAGRALKAAEARSSFYRRGLDRLDGRWAGRGDSGARYLEADHPFDADLDLFGDGSVFERLCTARTGAGKDRLARWLLEGGEPEAIVRRHGAVLEFKGQLDLREDIDLLGSAVAKGAAPGALIAWGRGRAGLPIRGVRVGAWALAIANLAAAIGWAFTEIGPRPLVLSALATAALSVWTLRRLGPMLATAGDAAGEFALLAALLERIERGAFTSEALRGLRAEMAAADVPPSRRLARLGRLVGLFEYRRNQMFVPIAFLSLWPVQFGLAIEGWRRRSGDAIADWLDAVGRFEALCALASYAFECPRDPFPTIEPGTAGPVFEAEGLGHPLIPEGECVRNDVALGGPEGPGLLLISGSNMSGKSTMLRAVGVNAVLAMAGAPVRAGSLRLSTMRPGATLRVQDSLREGRSRFFAEITRLRLLVDMASGRPPLLFLLDEILHGTNSRDRRAGAEGVVRGLLDRGAIGLVTTHDLALADIADALGDSARNVHFEDHLVDGEVRFDYAMRPGVVRKSNALALMRAVGLDV